MIKWLLLALVVCLAGVHLADRCHWTSLPSCARAELSRLLHQPEAAKETVTAQRVVSVDGRSFGDDGAAALAQLLSCLMTKDGGDGDALCGHFQRRGDDQVWAAAAGQPLVVRRLASAINASRQLPEWSAAGFLGAVGELQRVCTGVRSGDALLPFFYFDKRRALYAQVPLARSRWRAPYNVAPTMSSAEFLRRDDVYYSAPLDSVRSLDAATVAQLLDMHPLARRPDANRALWAGAAGVVSRLHYDAADNFYLQLSGRKTFHLLPPRHHWAASIYPFVHPASRQSQFPLERLLSDDDDDDDSRLDFDPDWLDAEHPLMRRAVNDLLVVTLQPGDLLFIPSFWLHHVTAVTASLSLSVFVRDYEKQLVADIFAAPPPHLGPYSDLPDRHQEALLFQLVADLLDAAAVLSRRPTAAADDDAAEPCDPRADYCFLDKQGWLKALVYSRWRLLPVDPMLGAAAAQLTHSRSDFACGDAAAVDSAPHLARSELANFAAATARQFRRLVRPVRHIILGDYIESLVSTVVPIADVHAYLVHCANVGFQSN